MISTSKKNKIRISLIEIRLIETYIIRDSRKRNIFHGWNYLFIAIKFTKGSTLILPLVYDALE